MRPLHEHTGRGVALRRSEVDTDQIIPAAFCKRLTKTGYEDALFATWREDPGFVLNDPDRAAASVLVAAHNFGTGSSREHAVWALRDWGFVVVVASSFGDIFRRNAFRNGLLAVELPEAVVGQLADRVDADPASEITVSVVDREVQAGDIRCPFAIGQRQRRLLLDGLDEIAVTLGADGAIAGYEDARHAWLPRTGVA